MRIRFHIILLALLAVFAICACAPVKKDAEAGIIGGADGPTEIVVTDLGDQSSEAGDVAIVNITDNPADVQIQNDAQNG